MSYPVRSSLSEEDSQLFVSTLGIPEINEKFIYFFAGSDLRATKRIAEAIKTDSYDDILRLIYHPNSAPHKNDSLDPNNKQMLEDVLSKLCELNLPFLKKLF